ncbi:MAG: hypothetical protein QOG21_1273 [Actinomycetota bacterium]|nr:hypothetical protein [Actinomycetota bacterium]
MTLRDAWRGEGANWIRFARNQSMIATTSF